MKVSKPVKIDFSERIPFTLERLRDMHHQATVERSHYYVGNLCREAISLIEDLAFVLFKKGP